MNKDMDKTIAWITIITIISIITATGTEEQNGITIEEKDEIMILGIPQNTYPNRLIWDPNETIQNPYVKELQEETDANIQYTTDIKKYCKKEENTACYHNNQIYIDAYKISIMPQTWATIHELGHALWFKKLTKKEQKEWINAYNKNDTITDYAAENYMEDFAENIAAYCHNQTNYDQTKKMGEEQIRILEKMLQNHNITRMRRENERKK